MWELEFYFSRRLVLLFKKTCENVPFLYCLTPTECNYDIGNEASGGEIGFGGVVTLAGWLSSSVFVWTDHENLQYIQQDKHLNSCKASHSCNPFSSIG